MTTAELLREVEAKRSLPPPAMRRAIREAAGVSQRKVAAALEVSDATIVRWEAGSHEPKGTRLIAYAALLDQLKAAS